ncbi:hypothetical protein NCAS_0H01560 [Naumovozyma castellii]|uniref:Uncharacterized protein n=1 Tax=Naumovozyma castellii TaxID=27288 RepID=G0VIY9_NAUCA|nr:hypothetical protein NCAS_0H01560 [Naumovozyma castellii CBS 4309]CCC71466.1 hypothetical protein NCAS_0H01560 [Naumovozyma castellii CBS 4309]
MSTSKLGENKNENSKKVNKGPSLRHDPSNDKQISSEGLIKGETPKKERPLKMEEPESLGPPERYLYKFDGKNYVNKKSGLVVSTGEFIRAHYEWLGKTSASSNHSDTNLGPLEIDDLIRVESQFAAKILGKPPMSKHYLHTFEFFFMEFLWEESLIDKGLEVEDSDANVKFHRLLYELVVFWRNYSRKERRIPNFTMLHAVKELECFRIYIKKSVAWLYQHTKEVKPLLLATRKRSEEKDVEWGFPDWKQVPSLEMDGIDEFNIDSKLNELLAVGKGLRSG